jgi:hypothetical protein
MRQRTSTRERLIEKARVAFEARGIHWHMVLFVVGTAGVGMLASWIMLALGLRVIWLRYVLAVGIAYAGFLLFVRWWLDLTGADGSAPGVDDIEVLDSAMDFAAGVLDGADQSAFAASADSVSTLASPPVAPPATGSPLGSIELPDMGDVDSDAAPLLLLIILAVVALGGVIAAGFLIYSAPVFFAEVFVDAAISYGLYRRLRPADGRHWLQSAIARTWLPFLIVAALLGFAGEAIHEFIPGAVSIGDVFRAR